MPTRAGRRWISLTTLLVKLSNAGIFVMLCLHTITHPESNRGVWWDGEAGESAQQISPPLPAYLAWAKLANRYCKYSNVILADVYNEPHGASWETWRDYVRRVGDSILERCPRWLIAAQGAGGGTSEGYWWGENIAGQVESPIILRLPNRLVLSPHVYGHGEQAYMHDPTFPRNLPAVWSSHFGRVAEESDVPLIIGEWGGVWVDTSFHGREFSSTAVWQRAFAAYLVEKGFGSFYWTLNDNSRRTGSLFFEMPIEKKSWRCFLRFRLRLFRSSRRCGWYSPALLRFPCSHQWHLHSPRSRLHHHRAHRLHRLLLSRHLHPLRHPPPIPPPPSSPLPSPPSPLPRPPPFAPPLAPLPAIAPDTFASTNAACAAPTSAVASDASFWICCRFAERNTSRHWHCCFGPSALAVALFLRCSRAARKSSSTQPARRVGDNDRVRLRQTSGSQKSSPVDPSSDSQFWVTADATCVQGVGVPLEQSLPRADSKQRVARHMSQSREVVLELTETRESRAASYREPKTNASGGATASAFTSKACDLD